MTVQQYIELFAFEELWTDDLDVYEHSDYFEIDVYDHPVQTKKYEMQDVLEGIKKERGLIGHLDDVLPIIEVAFKSNQVAQKLELITVSYSGELYVGTEDCSYFFEVFTTWDGENLIRHVAFCSQWQSIFKSKLTGYDPYKPKFTNLSSRNTLEFTKVIPQNPTVSRPKGKIDTTTFKVKTEEQREKEREARRKAKTRSFELGVKAPRKTLEQKYG